MRLHKGRLVEDDLLFTRPKVSNARVPKEMKTKMTKAAFGLCLAVSASMMALSVRAEERLENTMVFQSDFFDKYNPVTALDMVERVPGFTLERNDSGPGGDDQVRGFGGAAGNVLVNGKRPSTKSDSIADILERYSAKDVARITLIRGSTGSLDVGKASVVVDVTLNEMSSRPRTTYSLRHSYEAENMRLNGNISTSGKLQGVDFTVGVKREGFKSHAVGPETVTRNFDPDEFRDEIAFYEENDWAPNVSLETEFGQGQILRFNTKANIHQFDLREESNQFTEGEDVSRDVVRTYRDDFDKYEIGADYERPLTKNFDLKLIALFSRKSTTEISTLDTAFTDGSSEFNNLRVLSDEGETIGRAELDWSIGKNHALQFGGEVAHNFVDSSLNLSVDDGSGPQEVIIPGGDTKVEELRGEIFLSDAWSISSRLSVDAGLAVEFSTIEQSGDIGMERSFTYFKPHAALTWSPREKSQVRLRAEREVGQLDFFDFVSSRNFEDEDVEFGNPDLQPERSWHISATFEQRFFDIGVVEVETFIDLIDDVEDMLPLGGTFESPGNIGSGKRWGVKGKLTLPFDSVGWHNARFIAKYDWQDSQVTDPVTGRHRQLSNETPKEYRFEFRQELPSLKSSFGIDYYWQTTRTEYGLDEIIRRRNGDSGLRFKADTMVLGFAKLNFEVGNMLASGFKRERTVFVGSRADGIVDFVEFRSPDFKPWYSLSISGVF